MLSIFIISKNPLCFIDSLSQAPAIQSNLLGHATDSRQAAQALTHLFPDILILDIDDDVIGAFALMRELAQTHPQTHYLIACSSQDFALLKEALLYGAQGFLQKPFDWSELETCLQSIRDQIRKQRKALCHAARPMEQKYHQQRMKNTYLRFFNYQLEYDEFERKLNNLHEPYNAPYVQCFCINFPASGFCNTSCIPYEHRPAIEAALNETTGGYTRIVHPYKNTYLLVVQQPCQTDHAGVIAQKLHSLLNEHAVISSGPVVPREHLIRSFERCLQQTLVRFCDPSDTLTATHDSALPILDTRILAAMLQRGKYADCKLFVATFIDRAQASEFVSGILNICQMLFQHLDETLTQNIIQPAILPYYILRFRNRNHLSTALQNLIDNLPRTPTDITGMVIQFIETNYSQRLTLLSLGQLFHVHPTYLGQLILQKTSVTFHAYLADLRLKKACYIIKTHRELPLSEIAKTVGFSDPHYFSKCFRQRFGMTATAYRKQYQ